VQEKQKTYFASDFHLGVPNHEESRKREDLIVEWLDNASKDAKAIYLLGDIFDFWFEYKHAIPKGFIRIQGKIASLVDQGLPIHIFIGNHDMWMFDYFEKEIGIKIIREPITVKIDNKTFRIGHGDGLGPGDKGYKFIKKVFANKFFQWCFARLHPNFGIGMANYWSRKSRAKNKEPQTFLGEDKEWLVSYCKEELQKQPIDYFVFGHRHLPIEFEFENGAKYINLGDWLEHYTYAVFDGTNLELKKLEGK